MKHILLTRALAASLFFTITTSCEKILETEPLASLPADEAYTTRQGLDAGLNGMYSSLAGANYYGLRYPTFADMGADNILWRGTFPSFQQIYQNNILPDNVELSNMWGSIYSSISRTNYIIAAAETFNDPAYNKVDAIGQARGLRAFHYMNLLGYWGGSPSGYGQGGLGVPLRLEPVLLTSETDPIPRSSEQEVIDQVNADLDFAIANCANTNKGFMSKNAAIALKARFALRNGNYQMAADLTNQLKSSTGTYPLVANYADLYLLKNQTESIWELQYNAVNTNQFAFFWYPTANGGRNELDPSATLLSAHEAGDKRLPVNTVTTATVPGAPIVGITQKFSRVLGDDNFVIVRYAEVALTRAEALARLGTNTEEALTLLNAIRTRAGLPARTALAGTALINAILQERRVELAHEGLRWFDLRRTNSVATTLSGFTQPFRNLWPIPQREVLNSVVNGRSEIEQNPGY